jgi:hypothetical protein
MNTPFGAWLTDCYMLIAIVNRSVFDFQALRCFAKRLPQGLMLTGIRARPLQIAQTLPMLSGTRNFVRQDQNRTDLVLYLSYNI